LSAVLYGGFFCALVIGGAIENAKAAFSPLLVAKINNLGPLAGNGIKDEPHQIAVGCYLNWDAIGKWLQSPMASKIQGRSRLPFGDHRLFFAGVGDVLGHGRRGLSEVLADCEPQPVLGREGSKFSRQGLDREVFIPGWAGTFEIGGLNADQNCGGLPIICDDKLPNKRGLTSRPCGLVVPKPFDNEPRPIEGSQHGVDLSLACRPQLFSGAPESVSEASYDQARERGDNAVMPVYRNGLTLPYDPKMAEEAAESGDFLVRCIVTGVVLYCLNAVMKRITVSKNNSNEDDRH
jgi:hypothetical protein